MDKFVIQGPNKIFGDLKASGSKNAALPILFSTILSDSKNHKIKNVPCLHDMESTLRMLLHFGAHVEQRFDATFGAEWNLNTSGVNKAEAPYDLVRKMRASFFSVGPLLGRLGWGRVSLPGGCAIGARPVDLHLFAFEKLGATIHQENGYVDIKAPGGRLIGNKVLFPKISVGATENLMMAAVLARGETLIENAACEPEVRYLGEALKSMGARIEGHGSPKISIQGVDSLGALDFSIPSDRIEVGTYLIAAQLLEGDLTVMNAPLEDLGVVLEKLKASGASIDIEASSVRIVGSEKILPVDITTEEFPGFATDLQAQWVALMTHAEGETYVEEKIFENRFMHVSELMRMGGQYEISGSKVKIKGKKGILKGAPVMATDLRASASLVLAGLAAEGRTDVKRIYHLDRGYESMEIKFRELGANLERQLDD
jgi:UDP-N-acetylglucosamine 1-carboxyvinyltransferase